MPLTPGWPIADGDWHRMPLRVHRFLVLKGLPEVLLAERCLDVFEFDDPTKRIAGVAGVLLSTCLWCLLSHCGEGGGGWMLLSMSGDQKRRMCEDRMLFQDFRSRNPSPCVRVHHEVTGHATTLYVDGCSPRSWLAEGGCGTILTRDEIRAELRDSTGDRYPSAASAEVSLIRGSRGPPPLLYKFPCAVYVQGKPIL